MGLSVFEELLLSWSRNFLQIGAQYFITVSEKPTITLCKVKIIYNTGVITYMALHVSALRVILRDSTVKGTCVSIYVISS
jgi:hypothetical protein